MSVNMQINLLVARSALRFGSTVGNSEVSLVSLFIIDMQLKVGYIIFPVVIGNYLFLWKIDQTYLVITIKGKYPYLFCFLT